GLASGLNRYVARYDAENEPELLKQIVATAGVIQIGVALITLIAGALVATNIEQVFHLEEPQLYRAAATIAVLFAAMLGARMLSWPARGVLTGRHLWSVNSSLSAYGDFLALGVAVTVLTVFDGGLVMLASAYLGATIVTESMRVFFARRAFKQPIYALQHARKAMARKLVMFGVKSNLLGMTQIMVMQTLRIVLVNAVSPATLAIYARPQALRRFAATFVSSYSALLTPTASSLQGLQREEEMRDFLLSSLRVTASLALPLSIGLALYGDIIIATWMGPEYVVPWLNAAVGAGGFLVTTHSAVVTIMMGLNQHGKLALRSLLITAIVFACGLAWGSYVGWSPVVAAIVAGVSLSIGCGAYYAWFACRTLHIGAVEYLLKVYTVPVSCNLAFAALLWTPMQLGLTLNFFDMLLWSAAGAVLLASLYWRLLLNAQTRQRVLRKIPGINKRRS
ncbi:MAG: oligosaccharide flippase family protein, partial [Pseudomonadota bacterium]